MKILFAFFAALLGAIPGFCQTTVPDAQPRMDSMMLHHEVVITAQRQRQDNYRLPLFTSVLNRDYLFENQPRSVPEALFGTPGVFLQKTNHGGGSPFVRGLTGQQVLLLVDGIRLNNATFRSGPNQYLHLTDPSWVDRIEVLRSSGAAEYGSDAIGGVVHVCTRPLVFSDKNSIRPEASFKWMSGGMETGGQAALEASGRRWALRAGGAYRDFGDLVAGKGLGKETPTGYRLWSGEAKAALRINDQVTLTAAYQDMEQQDVPLFHKVQLENFKYNSFDPQRRQMGYARLEGTFKSRWWRKAEITASRQYMLEVRRSQKNGQPVQLTETDKTLTDGLQANVLSKISNNWEMTTGAEYYADEVRSATSALDVNTGSRVGKRGLYPDGSTMRSLAVFNLHTYTWRRLTATGGLRYNALRVRVPNEQIGISEISPSAWVGHAGMSWGFTQALRLYANGSSAFRAPNVDDLGTLGVVDFRYELPNYALRPEKSRSVEAGLKIKTRRFAANLSAYYLHLDELIGRVRTADSLQGYPVYFKENISAAFIRGADIQVEWHFLPRWTLNGHLSHCFGQNTTAAEPLRRIPPGNGRLCLQFAPQPWIKLHAETVFAAAQRRLAQADIADNRIADDGTPGWQIVNAGAFCRYRSWSLALEMHNIANTAYRMHGSGVDGTGRSVWLLLQYRLRPRD